MSSSVSHHIVQFNNSLVDLLSYIKSTLNLPTVKKAIKHSYKYYKSQDPIDYVRQWLQASDSWKDYIGRCDDSIFYCEADLSNQNLSVFYWLPKMDFRIIWRALETTVPKDQRSAVKNTIFNNLQNLLILAFYIVKEHDKWSKKLAKHQMYIKQLKASIRLDKLVKTDVAQDPDLSITKVTESFGFLDTIFKQKNFILEIAIDIASELHSKIQLNVDANTPLNMVKELIRSGQLEEMKSLIIHKIEQKMKDLNISEQDIMNQLQSLGNLPGMQNIKELSEKIVASFSQLSPDEQVNPEVILNKLQQEDFLEGQHLDELGEIINMIQTSLS